MYNYFTTYILKLLHLSLCGAEDGRMMDDIRIPNDVDSTKKRKNSQEEYDYVINSYHNGSIETKKKLDILLVNNYLIDHQLF